MEEAQMHIASERNQSGKATHCIIPSIEHSGKGETIKRKKVSGRQGLGQKQQARGTFRSVKLFRVIP